jgi:hypothetical protein
MATVPQQPDGNRGVVLTNQLAPLVDLLSKGVAAIAIALYACGFLIVSLHHAKYGFIGTNLFRPRILAAGAWFFFFAAIPVTVAMRYRTLSWIKAAQDLYAVWLGCLGLSFPLSYLLFDLSDYPPASDPKKFWWVWVIAVVVSGALILIQNSKKLPPSVSAALSVVIVVVFVQDTVRELFVKHIFHQQAVSLWFLICIVVTMVEVKTRSSRNLAEGEWSKPLATLFAVLLVFAQYYYPHLKASWGGGTPISATIYFTKDSPINPDRTVSTQLIDESDEGFYILGPKETKAIFVPRSAVALVYFSDKVADSPLLRDNKQN